VNVDGDPKMEHVASRQKAGAICDQTQLIRLISTNIGLVNAVPSFGRLEKIPLGHRIQSVLVSSNPRPVSPVPSE